MFEKIQSFTSPVINWDIAKQPLNWVIIPLILVLGGVALGLIFHPANTADNT